MVHMYSLVMIAAIIAVVVIVVANTAQIGNTGIYTLKSRAEGTVITIPMNGTYNNSITYLQYREHGTFSSAVILLRLSNDYKLLTPSEEFVFEGVQYEAVKASPSEVVLLKRR